MFRRELLLLIALAGQAKEGTKAVLLPKKQTAYSNLVQLDARKSVSPDGKPLRYHLRQISGNTANILHADTDMPSLQLAGYGRYEFELTVTDSSGAEAKDRAVVDYNGH